MPEKIEQPNGSKIEGRETTGRIVRGRGTPEMPPVTVTITTENPGLEKFCKHYEKCLNHWLEQAKESRIIDMAIKEMVDCLHHGYIADPADVVARCTAKVELMGIRNCTCPCHQGANMMHIQPCCEECE